MRTDISLRLPAGLLASMLLSSSSLSAQELSHATVDSWPTTTYYLGFSEFASKTDGQILIAAGGRYTLYLNGELVGSDQGPDAAQSYEVSFKRRVNHVAVIVQHDGRQSPYGLFCVLDGGEERFVSSPTDRANPYFWTGTPLPNEEDADWMTIRQRNLGDYEENGEAVRWQPVQAGNLDPGLYAEFADLDLTRNRSMAGFAGGLAGHQGGLQLRDLAGQNMAFNTLSTEPNMVDGNLSTSVNFRKGAGALLQSVETDLGRQFFIARVRVITQPPSGKTNYEDLSLRGYSILVSKDGVEFLEVGSQNQIATFQESEVVFPPIPARHVRLTITEFSNRNAAPRVGELEVYVQGLDQQGTYRSPQLNLGTDDRKNFERVQWFGSVPANAEMNLRFRSGDDGQTWSAWSDWSPDRDRRLDVPEPRRFLQFESRLASQALAEGPVLDSLVVSYDSGPIPATRAAASILPLRASIGVDTLFTYTLELDIGAGDAGIGRLAITTPWPASLDRTAVQGLGDAGLAEVLASNDSLVLVFDPPITAETGTTELVIPFTTRLLAASHAFQGLLFPPDAVSSLRIQAREGADPNSGLAYSITASATDFDIAILDDVRAEPATFTPNGDTINDEAVLGFVLGRVNDAEVHFEVYDLGGRLVRTLPTRTLNAGNYGSKDGLNANLPGRWDGRGDDGEVLPPGLYVFRVVVHLKPDKEVGTGVIGLAY